MKTLQFKGTQGKWNLEKNSLSSLSPKGQFTIKAGEAGTPIAILSLPLGNSGAKQLENAKLIAAAPDLLEALFYTLKALDAITIVRKPEAIIKAAELAIEKALK